MYDEKINEIKENIDLAVKLKIWSKLKKILMKVCNY